MGSENNSLPEVVIGVWSDGQYTIFRPGDLQDDDLTEYGYARDDPGPPGDPGLPWDQQSVTLTAECSKYFRCGSRKRLKKLLMANKLSRDEAERMVRQVCGSGLSYREAWRQIWPQLMVF